MARPRGDCRLSLVPSLPPEEPDRWWNVVVTIIKAADLPLDATAEQRRAAVVELVDAVLEDDRLWDGGEAVVVTGNVELVEDGQPVEPLPAA